MLIMSEFEPVLLTLPSSSSLTPSMALEILPHGLTIHRFLIQTDGRTHDVVIGPESPKDHVTQKYTNSIVGRYANRIPVGTHFLERNGIRSEFTAQPNESPQVSLHGGPKAFDAVPWTVLSDTDVPKLFSAAELSRLATFPKSSYAIFRLVSPSGDQGYPGKLLVEALASLVGPGKPQPVDDSNAELSLGSLALVYRAKLDDENFKLVTPVNLTQHWGFNLDASLQDGLLSIKDHILNIKADRIAELGAHSLGTGQFIPVAEVPAHDHKSKRVGERFPEKGYDDYYAFEDEARSSVPSRIPLTEFNSDSDLLKDLLRPSDDEVRGNRTDILVEISSAKSGLKLAFDSNQHGVMFYSNALANPRNGARKKIHGGSGISGQGDAYDITTAAFLEFHNPLAAFLRDENKGAEDTLLTSDELYHNYVRCDVKYKSPQKDSVIGN
ncbi:galactose mutarotase-like domain-containing protein [Crassisporium funariophilum]|nr:galactose mutarotase-like domain-containing protein [Crassisporium funariophilum]